MYCVEVIGKWFDTKTDFFKALKVFISPKRVRAVHAVPAGLEITFFPSSKLQAFVENAPEDWKITSECTGVKMVTHSKNWRWTCFGSGVFCVDMHGEVWASD